MDTYRKIDSIDKSRFKQFAEDSDTTNYYDAIRTPGRWKAQYTELYNNRCCYCGYLLTSSPTSYTEIDHYIPLDEDKTLKHDIDNLVCSCRSCNRKKSSKRFHDLYHPDNSEINTVFYRDENYKIKIVDDYSDDDNVNFIYNSLKFNARFHQFRYLYEVVDDKLKSTDLSDKDRAKLEVTKEKLKQGFYAYT